LGNGDLRKSAERKPSERYRQTVGQKSKMGKTFILTLFLFLLTNTKASGQRSGHSLFCNDTNPQTSRILLYDKDCYMWVRRDTLLNEEILRVTFGHYTVNGDTLNFNCPDTTRKPNKYFCYCGNKYNKTKQPNLYSSPETYPPNDIKNVYKAMFKASAPNLTEIHTSESFKGIRTKNKITLLYYNRDKRPDGEYTMTKN